MDKEIELVCGALARFLKEKNKRYGNSALSPVGIWSRLDSEAGLLVRMDDKLSRIRNSPEWRKNDVVDHIGYEILLCIKRGWLDFGDLID